MWWRQRKAVQPSRSALSGYSTGDSSAGRHRLRDRGTVPVFDYGHQWPEWATERTRLLPTVDTLIVRPYVFNSDAHRRRELWLR
jgi:hypothetical protein